MAFELAKMILLTFTILLAQEYPLDLPNSIEYRIREVIDIQRCADGKSCNSRGVNAQELATAMATLEQVEASCRGKYAELAKTLVELKEVCRAASNREVLGKVALRAGATWHVNRVLEIVEEQIEALKRSPQHFLPTGESDVFSVLFRRDREETGADYQAPGHNIPESIFDPIKPAIARLWGQIDTAAKSGTFKSEGKITPQFRTGLKQQIAVHIPDVEILAVSISKPEAVPVALPFGRVRIPWLVIESKNGEVLYKRPSAKYCEIGLFNPSGVSQWARESKPPTWYALFRGTRFIICPH